PVPSSPRPSIAPSPYRPTAPPFEIAGALERQSCLGRGRQVSGAAEQPGKPAGNGVEHLAARVAGGQALGVGREGRDLGVPALGEAARAEAVELAGLVGIGAAVGGQLLVPPRL